MALDSGTRDRLDLMKDQYHQKNAQFVASLLSFRKRIVCALLAILMLVSPLMASAKSIIQSHGQPLSDTHVTGTPDLSQMKMENCHEVASEPSERLGSLTDTDNVALEQHSCCADVCECDQSNCHSPLAVLESTEGLLKLLADTGSSFVLRYNNPTLNSLNPPPII